MQVYLILIKWIFESTSMWLVYDTDDTDGGPVPFCPRFLRMSPRLLLLYSVKTFFSTPLPPVSSSGLKQMSPQVAMLNSQGLWGLVMIQAVASAEHKTKSKI